MQSPTEAKCSKKLKLFSVTVQEQADTSRAVEDPCFGVVTRKEAYFRWRIYG